MVFPFLEMQHELSPYALHYYLWRLSFSFGQTYSQLSLSYEDLTAKFEQTFGTLLADLGIEGVDMTALARMNRGTVPLRWPAYADDEWFSAIEAECERTLAIYFAGLRSRD